MGYENAPATKMLATHCCMCGKELIDAQSVEMGIGPICRKKWLTQEAVSEAVRRAGNKLIYQISACYSAGNILEALALTAGLEELGFVHVPARVRVRLAKVRVRNLTETSFAFEAPYAEEAIPAWRRVGRWMGKQEGGFKGYEVPVSKRAALWDLLRKYYPGEVAWGEKGAFVVPQQEV